MGEFCLKGVLIGLLFGIPAGAVGAMTARHTWEKGIKAGLVTGLGSSASDCIYAGIGAFGLTMLSNFLLRYQKVIHLLGGGLILFVGFRLLLSRQQEAEKTADTFDYVKMFLTSFAVGITNPASILTFLFAFSWLEISGQMEMLQGCCLVFGVFVGTYFWWSTLTAAIFWIRRKSGSLKMHLINRIFGTLLCLLGIFILVQVFF